LEWESTHEAERREVPIRLEYGRVHVLPSLEASEGDWIAHTFIADDAFGIPSLEIRPANTGGGWLELGGIRRLSAGSQRLRVIAARRPLPLGHRFTARLTDTWVTTGPPEDQLVEWTFVSPCGNTYSVMARYAGGFRWEVEFDPDEIGPWRYRWTQSLHGPGVSGPATCIDVIGLDIATVHASLDRFAERARSGDDRASKRGRRRQLQALLRLERSAVALLTPTEWRSEAGEDTRRKINAAKAALWGREVPEQPPFESHTLVTERDGSTLRDPYPFWPAHTTRRVGRTRVFFRRLRRRLGKATE
jgi:hypothetical protein